MHDNEVMRGFKTVNDSYIEPISFIVPRRAEVFQGDIYPPVTGSKPGTTANQWLSGKDALPPKIDMESIYKGQEPVEVPSDHKPPSPVTPAAPPKEEKKPELKREPEPEPEPPASARAPPPSMKEQGKSMASMANKFTDKEKDDDDGDDDDETSSFEEVAAQPATRLVAKRNVDEFEHVPKPSAAAAKPVHVDARPPDASKVRRD